MSKKIQEPNFFVLILREFVPKGQTISAKCYLEVIKLLIYRIRRIRPITALFVRFGSSRLSFISKAQAQDEKSHFLRHSSDPKILLKAVPQNEFSRAFEQPYRRCNECITSQNLNVEVRELFRHIVLDVIYCILDSERSDECIDFTIMYFFFIYFFFLCLSPARFGASIFKLSLVSDREVNLVGTLRGQNVRINPKKVQEK
ncbi:Uncharacterized protein FWK35_00003555 [Aphis craccivora]|uniref:Uncharacterized protein n=1 Tax=Aphis craccivora TaxID=307492 RepID=A0A6G0ZG43_APHCR|nr:Uncharacterized protein FWK35_00003555 [Aphis craccivora]